MCIAGLKLDQLGLPCVGETGTDEVNESENEYVPINIEKLNVMQ